MTLYRSILSLLLTYKAYSTKMNFVIKHTCCTYFFAKKLTECALITKNAMYVQQDTK